MSLEFKIAAEVQTVDSDPLRQVTHELETAAGRHGGKRSSEPETAGEECHPMLFPVLPRKWSLLMPLLHLSADPIKAGSFIRKDIPFGP